MYNFVTHHQCCQPVIRTDTSYSPDDAQCGNHEQLRGKGSTIQRSTYIKPHVRLAFPVSSVYSVAVLLVWRTPGYDPYCRNYNQNNAHVQDVTLSLAVIALLR